MKLMILGTMEKSHLDLCVTLGREFCNAIETQEPEVTGQDCYDAVSEVLGSDFNVERLVSLTEYEIDSIATSFQTYFENQDITTEQIRIGIKATISNWV